MHTVNGIILGGLQTRVTWKNGLLPLMQCSCPKESLRLLARCVRAAVHNLRFSCRAIDDLDGKSHVFCARLDSKQISFLWPECITLLCVCQSLWARRFWQKFPAQKSKGVFEIPNVNFLGLQPDSVPLYSSLAGCVYTKFDIGFACSVISTSRNREQRLSKSLKIHIDPPSKGSRTTKDLARLSLKRHAK